MTTAFEDLHRVLDSHSKRQMNETTTDFERLRELMKAMLAERKEVIGIPYLKDLTDEVDVSVGIVRGAAHHFCARGLIHFASGSCSWHRARSRS